MTLTNALLVAVLIIALVILALAVDVYREVVKRGRTHSQPREDHEDMSTPKTDAAIDRLKTALAADRSTAVSNAVAEAAATAADASDTEAAGKVDAITSSLAQPEPQVQDTPAAGAGNDAVTADPSADQPQG